MTTTPAPDSASWFGHRAAQIWAAILIAMAVASLVAPIEVYGPVSWAGLVGIGVCLIARLRHDRSLCTRCVDEWPADGQQRADRTSAFLLHHTASRIQLLALALLLAATFLADDGSLIDRLAEAAFFGAFAVLQLAGRRHAQLLPWCPYCRDDGGDDAHDPTPAPDPSAVKTA